MLVRLFDERIGLLLERQMHPDADALRGGLRIAVRRSAVGGLHQPRAAARDDVAAHCAQAGAHLPDLVINPVSGLVRAEPNTVTR